MGYYFKSFVGVTGKSPSEMQILLLNHFFSDTGLSLRDVEVLRQYLNENGNSSVLDIAGSVGCVNMPHYNHRYLEWDAESGGFVGFFASSGKWNHTVQQILYLLRDVLQEPSFAWWSGEDSHHYPIDSWNDDYRCGDLWKRLDLKNDMLYVSQSLIPDLGNDDDPIGYIKQLMLLQRPDSPHAME